mgnify:CR=1 FL=1
MKTISEQEKAEKLLTLTGPELGMAADFIKVTVANKLKYNALSSLSEKQQKWFDDLYDRHFGGEE